MSGTCKCFTQLQIYCFKYIAICFCRKQYWWMYLHQLLNKWQKWRTVCSCHVTYAFQSESTLYSCLNGWVLAKWLSVRLWTKWLWVRVQLQSLKSEGVYEPKMNLINLYICTRRHQNSFWAYPLLKVSK